MNIDLQNTTFPLQYSLATINNAANSLVTKLGAEKVWLFDGEMGSGKTTLIKEICRVLLVEDNVTSPTFSIVNEYSALQGTNIYHFDFYRIKSEIEAMDIGCDEYFYSGNYCFIEWPSKIPHLLPEKYVTITIDIVDENERRCSFSINQGR
ncbi:MAG TPA: tRNA (adenosine(37)-N6)-threonylcarbamoyltransferase complex ATPase subunit type 1 TsaE [Cytophagaceae bacterium]|jgi:tRNA threonylcarbamoyladenosine biosynthesis protein TsaE